MAAEIASTGPLEHVNFHWTMVGRRAIAGPFATPREALEAGRGIYGVWVQSGSVTAPGASPREQRR